MVGSAVVSEVDGAVPVEAAAGCVGAAAGCVGTAAGGAAPGLQAVMIKDRTIRMENNLKTNCLDMDPLSSLLFTA